MSGCAPAGHVGGSSKYTQDFSLGNGQDLRNGDNERSNQWARRTGKPGGGGPRRTKDEAAMGKTRHNKKTRERNWEEAIREPAQEDRERREARQRVTKHTERKEQEEAINKKATTCSPLMQRMAHCDQPDGLNDQQCEWFYQRFPTGASCIVSAIPKYET